MSHDDDPLDRYMDAFGDRLRHTTTTTSESAKRRGPRVRWLAGPIVTGALAITALLLLLPGGSTTRRLDVIAEARAALQPQDGRLIHLVVRQHVVDPHRPGFHVTAPPVTTEQWSATDPVRWRMAWVQPDNVAHNGGKPIEIAYADSAEETYYPRSNRLLRVTGLGRFSAPAAYPLGTDPVATLRSMLATSRLHDDGAAAIDGRPVRRLTGTRSRTFDKGRVTVPVVYYVDPTSFAPVRARLGVPMPADAGGGVPLTVVLDFHRFEQLPLTAANAELLKIHPRPGADVREVRAKHAAQRPAKRTG
jgi:hypothetical protein